MTDDELLRLLRDLECDRAERKTSAADTKKIRQAICAFANDMPNHRQPGVLFIGVNDDGTCAKLPVSDELLVNLGNIRDDGNILPLPDMIVQKRTLDGCEVAVVIVQPSTAPPVRFRGRVWIRVGPRRAIASVSEEKRLNERRRAQDLPFDLQPVVSATLDDLDQELFMRTYLPSSIALDILEQNERSYEEQLMSLRMIATDGSSKPTVLGLLVCGKEPRQFLPGAYIQFLRLDGTDTTDPIKDQKEIAGPLSELLWLLDETFRAHISVATDVTSAFTEIRSPDYPLEALQQIGRNAVLHRTYDGTNAPVRLTWFDDRIEILSPGGPYGQVSRDNFGQPHITDYRNPELAEAMKNLGYIQRFGIGIALARKRLAENGNPTIEFTIEDNYVLATIRKKSEPLNNRILQ